MFIRWQSRKRRQLQYRSSSDTGDDTHWRAILVESVRIDGKPRLRHVAYICGFTESAATVLGERRELWDRVDARLNRLGNLAWSPPRIRLRSLHRSDDPPRINWRLAEAARVGLEAACAVRAQASALLKSAKFQHLLAPAHWGPYPHRQPRSP
jgi:hypothetical protein